MSDLPIQIELDPTAAVQGAKKVTDEVRKTEEAAKRAEQAYAALGETFRKIAENEKRLADDAGKARRAVDNLANSFKGFGQAIANTALTNTAKQFDSLTQAIKREQEVLKSIHGPMEQLIQDQQILNKLQREGRISTEQHAKALASSKSRAGMSEPSSGLGELAMSALPAAGPAAAIGLGAQAITQALDAYAKYRLETDQATNSLVRFFKTNEAAASQLDRFRDLQTQLRTDLHGTIEAFDAVEGATKTLYLTTQEQIAITRNLGMTMKTDGKSIEAVGPILERIEFYMDRGTITGGELQKMMKQFPPLSEAWQKEFGVNAKQLIAMADAGKLNGAEIGRLVTTFKDGTEATRAFNEQTFTTDDAVKSVGGSSMPSYTVALIKNKIAMASLQEEGEGYIEQIDRMVKGLQKLHDQNENRAAGLAGGIAGERVDKALNDTARAVAKASKELEKHNELMNFIGDDGAKKYHERIDELNKELKAGTITQLDYELGLDKLNKKHGDAAKAINTHQAELKKLSNAYAKSVTDALVQRLEAEQAYARSVIRNEALGVTAQSMEFPSAEQINASAHGNGNRYPSDAADALKATQEEAKKLDDLIRDQLTSSATAFSDALVDAAHGADVSWKSLGESLLTTFEKAIAQALVLKALTGSIDGAKGAAGYGGLFGLLGGGATGFDYLAGAGPHLPGFATGGDMTVGGAGGVDSMLAMFRVTPGESIHVRTPEQRREAERGSSGGGGGLRVIQVDADPRALMPGTGYEDEDTVFLRWASKNADKLKRLIT